MSKTGVISGINGPIVHVKDNPGFTMNEMVYVGHDNLVGGGHRLKGRGHHHPGVRGDGRNPSGRSGDGNRSAGVSNAGTRNSDEYF